MQSYPMAEATANGSGVATTSLPTQATTNRWRIRFISVQSSSALQSIATVYLNNQPVIATSKGNLDSASGEPPIPITGKDQFTIQWTGCTPGAKCNAVLWYDDVNNNAA